MAMIRWVRASLGAVVGLGLGACAGSPESGLDGDCVSRYSSVGRGHTWPELRSAMLDNTDWGRVASLRTQERGPGVVGAGRDDVVRVVDLLSSKGRRLAQADVWRTDAGAWRAGVWSQCTD